MRIRDLLCVLSCTFSMAASAVEAARDPVAWDPRPQDPPPFMDAVAIPSGAARMNGIVYVPGGEGPHPVAIVLHGLPGNERNLDLAQVLRRDGWAVVFFHYRGAWGSGGEFGFGHVLEDVDAALDWSLGDEARERFRLDEGPRALVGHSMGGFAALVAGGGNGAVGCIASMAGADLGNLGLAAREEPAAGQVRTAFDALLEGPLRGTDGTAMLAELQTHGEQWRFESRVEDLKAHRVLLVASERDEVAAPAANHDPLLAALVQADADVTSVLLDDDHAFSGTRVALAREIVNWLALGCR